MNSSKIQASWARAYKNKIVWYDKYKWQIVWSQFSIKILGVHFVNLVLDNNKWDIINGKLTKKEKRKKKKNRNSRLV